MNEREPSAANGFRLVARTVAFAVAFDRRRPRRYRTPAIRLELAETPFEDELSLA